MSLNLIISAKLHASVEEDRARSICERKQYAILLQTYDQSVLRRHNLLLQLDISCISYLHLFKYISMNMVFRMIMVNEPYL
jgi:hypothetical protein